VPPAGWGRLGAFARRARVGRWRLVAARGVREVARRGAAVKQRRSATGPSAGRGWRCLAAVTPSKSGPRPPMRWSHCVRPPPGHVPGRPPARERFAHAPPALSGRVESVPREAIDPAHASRRDGVCEIRSATDRRSGTPARGPRRVGKSLPSQPPAPSPARNPRPRRRLTAGGTACYLANPTSNHHRRRPANAASRTPRTPATQPPGQGFRYPSRRIRVSSWLTNRKPLSACGNSVERNRPARACATR
jgi:hypothetical protein